MAKAFNELDKHGDAATLSYAEWLTLLLDRETTCRHDKRLSARLRYAKFRHQAAPEDVGYRSPRGLECLHALEVLICLWYRSPPRK